ncbi:MAG: hypothetical protein AAGA43_04355 [Bacteroidota bacterium]
MLKHIGVVVFIGLLLIKTSAFHVHDHDDTTEEHENPCELCVLLIASQQSDTLILIFDYIQEKPVRPNTQVKVSTIDYRDIRTPLSTYLFSRPPPEFVC